MYYSKLSAFLVLFDTTDALDNGLAQNPLDITQLEAVTRKLAKQKIGKLSGRPFVRSQCSKELEHKTWP